MPNMCSIYDLLLINETVMQFFQQKDSNLTGLRIDEQKGKNWTKLDKCGYEIHTFFSCFLNEII